MQPTNMCLALAVMALLCFSTSQAHYAPAQRRQASIQSLENVATVQSYDGSRHMRKMLASATAQGGQPARALQVLPPMDSSIGVPDTLAELCPHFERSHKRHMRPNSRVSIALFATCPNVCHKNTSLVDTTLTSFFKHLHIPADTHVYVAYTQLGTDFCIEYERMLREYVSNYNSCFFISKSLSTAYLKIAAMVRDDYMLLLEHDWYMVPIQHTLADLVRALDVDPSINQIRFNQELYREFADGPAINITRAGVPLAITAHHWSNNPNLARTDFVKYRLPLVMDPSEGGTAGIEQPWVRTLGAKFDDAVKGWFIAGLALYGHKEMATHRYIVHLDSHAKSCDF